MNSIRSTLKRALLPNGFPSSVSDDYLEYQFWDSLQAFCSSIMNNLATQAILKGVGVGDVDATVLSATITWILKEGTSIVASLVFATIQSTGMDSNCKTWRMFADLLNDAAILIDLSCNVWPKHYFIFLQCSSVILRSLVGIAGGATRAALTQHQAKCNNMADVSAKDQSQERIVNLFALLCSLLIIPLVSDRSLFTWILFYLFSISHVYCNYKAIRAVRMQIFNAKRLAIFLDHFHHNEFDKLSVKTINLEENIWFFQQNDSDRVFQKTRFVKRDSIPDAIESNHCDGKFHVFINLNSNCFISISNESEPILMIESLCFLFGLLKQSDKFQKNFNKICLLMRENGWDLSAVLFAEMIDDDAMTNKEHLNKIE
ncbi:RUS1 family -like protein [Sarcoptes scabiei]|nr:RUS1 family -like protein [Sarcoptes scabiei]